MTLRTIQNTNEETGRSSRFLFVCRFIRCVKIGTYLSCLQVFLLNNPLKMHFPSFQTAALAEDTNEADQTEPTICMTCSTEVNMRHALRHMEKCFQKVSPPPRALLSSIQLGYKLVRLFTAPGNALVKLFT